MLLQSLDFRRGQSSSICAAGDIVGPSQECDRKLYRRLVRSIGHQAFISMFPTIAIRTMMNCGAVEVINTAQIWQVINDARCKEKFSNLVWGTDRKFKVK